MQKLLQQAAKKENAKVVVVSSSADSKFLAPLLAVEFRSRLCF